VGVGILLISFAGRLRLFWAEEMGEKGEERERDKLGEVQKEAGEEREREREREKEREQNRGERLKTETEALHVVAPTSHLRCIPRRLRHHSRYRHNLCLGSKLGHSTPRTLP